MKTCKEDEHVWIVIEWVRGSYHEGDFQPGMPTGNNLSHRASGLMCQRCLIVKKADQVLNFLNLRPR